MISRITKESISKMFKLLIEGEKAIEANRKTLNAQIDFDPMLLFKRLDFEHSKHITQDNFIKFLKLHQLEGNVNEIKFVILSYDSDSSKKMNYNQFLNMVLCQSYYTSKKSQLGYKDYYTEDTEKLLVRLIQSELLLAKTIISILPSIIKKEEFSVLSLIKELKGNHYLTEENLCEMVRQGWINSNKEQIRLLMRRLDLTKNGKITIEELNSIFYFPNDKPKNKSAQKRRPLSVDSNRIKRNSQKNKNAAKGKEIIDNKKNNNQKAINHIETKSNQLKDNTAQQNKSNINSHTIQTQTNVNHNRNLIIKRVEIQKQRDQSNTFKESSHRNNIHSQLNSPETSFQIEGRNDMIKNDQQIISRKRIPISSTIGKRKRNININTNENLTNIPISQRRKQLFSAENTEESKTQHETNYLSTITSARNVRNGYQISSSNNSTYYPHESSYQSYNTSRSNKNLRNNIIQLNTQSSVPVRVSGTLEIRQYPERENHDDDNYYVQSKSTKLTRKNTHKNSYNNYNLDSSNDDLLIIIWKQISEIEILIECSKLSLAAQEDFNLEDAFRIFEFKKKNQISFSDIKLGYASFNLFPSKREVLLLLRRYDINRKGYLNYADFFDMLIPFKRSIRNELEQRVPNNFRPSFNKTNVFNGITKQYLKELLSILINSEAHLDNLRTVINSDNEGIIKNFFKKMDKEGKGYLNQANIKEYINNNNISFTQKEVDLLFIRLDKNRDGRIQYEEVLRELVPLV